MSAKGSTFRLSDEAKKKISEARQRRKAELGCINTPESRAKMSEAASKRKASKEAKEKIRAAKKGKLPANFTEFQAKGHAAPKAKGEDNPLWKGDEVGYNALHAWVRRELGTPSVCSSCGTKESKRYEWANISGEYRRDLTDWRRLCVSCHRKEGFGRGEYEAWNKGLNIQTNTGRTHVKKGQRISKATEFKKGIDPHNKYLEPVPCLHCGLDFQPREQTRKFCSRQCCWANMKKTKAVELKES